MKTRRESVEAFRKPAAARTSRRRRRRRSPSWPDYLPAALTEDELQALVDEGDRGHRRVIRPRPRQGHGLASPQTRGRADGKVVSGLVAQALARADVAAHDTGH